jgi:hypothetical protein
VAAAGRERSDNFEIASDTYRAYAKNSWLQEGRKQVRV